MAGKSLVVLDFDGTLFFTDLPVSLAAKELLGKPMTVSSVRKLPRPVKGKIYELAFSKYTGQSRPNFQLIKRMSRLGKDFKVIVLTKRGNKFKRQTWDLINGSAITFVEAIYSTDNFDLDDEDWKLGKMRSYLKIYQKISLYEDKKENIDYIKSRIQSKRINYYLVSAKRIRKVN